jgi:hypothetical protein
MSAGITDSVRSRGFAVAVHLGLWLLLYLAVVGFRAKPPEYQDGDVAAGPAQSPVPVAHLDQLFSSTAITNIFPPTNVSTLFFTKHFTPAPVAPAAPPTTTKIELTFAGMYQTSDGTPQSLVKFGEQFINSLPGARVASNLFVADITMQTLTLTNPAGQTNLLPLNVKKQIEVPLK